MSDNKFTFDLASATESVKDVFGQVVADAAISTLPETVGLVYVDRSSTLNYRDHPEVVTALIERDWDSAMIRVDEWYMDERHETIVHECADAFGKVREFFPMLDDDTWEDVATGYLTEAQQCVRDAIYDRDTSDPLREMARGAFETVIIDEVETTVTIGEGVSASNIAYQILAHLGAVATCENLAQVKALAESFAGCVEPHDVPIYARLIARAELETLHDGLGNDDPFTFEGRVGVEIGSAGYNLDAIVIALPRRKVEDMRRDDEGNFVPSDLDCIGFNRK